MGEVATKKQEEGEEEVCRQESIRWGESSLQHMPHSHQYLFRGQFIWGIYAL
jgi:hypothetical protein